MRSVRTSSFGVVPTAETISIGKSSRIALDSSALEYRLRIGAYEWSGSDFNAPKVVAPTQACPGLVKPLRPLYQLICREERLSRQVSGGLVERNTQRNEVERWGGEQARLYRAGSLSPSETSTFSNSSLNRLRSCLLFFVWLSRTCLD